MRREHGARATTRGSHCPPLLKSAHSPTSTRRSGSRGPCGRCTRRTRRILVTQPDDQQPVAVAADHLMLFLRITRCRRIRLLVRRPDRRGCELLEVLRVHHLRECHAAQLPLGPRDGPGDLRGRAHEPPGPKHAEHQRHAREEIHLELRRLCGSRKMQWLQRHGRQAQRHGGHGGGGGCQGNQGVLGRGRDGRGGRMSRARDSQGGERIGEGFVAHWRLRVLLLLHLRQLQRRGSASGTVRLRYKRRNCFAQRANEQ